MKAEATMRHRREKHVLRAIGLVAGLSLAIAASCSRSDTTPAPGKDAPAQVGGSPRQDKDQYVVEMKAAAGACSAGKECMAEIKLKTKAPFHINDQFPIKFKTPDSPRGGLTFTKATLKREDGQFGEKEGTLPVGFTLAKAGRASVSGTLQFGVCSDTSCLVEKAELELEVEAK